MGKQQQDGELEAIQAAIAPVLARHAVELADLAWTTERAGRTLRITIERPGPIDRPWRPELGFGVSLEDCAAVSRDTSTVLDETDLVPHAYVLEVSSPGLDRPLFGARDFHRFRGNLAKLKLRVAAPDGQKVLRGSLAEAPEGRVGIVADVKRFEVAVADVESASLVFELPGEPKSARPSGPSRKKQAPKGPAPKELAPKELAPKELAPPSGAPESRAPESRAPESRAPESRGPKKTSPRAPGRVGAASK